MKRSAREGRRHIHNGPDKMIPALCKDLRQTVDDGRIEDAVWMALDVGLQSGLLAQNADQTSQLKNVGPKGSDKAKKKRRKKSEKARQAAFEIADRLGPNTSVGLVAAQLGAKGFRNPKTKLP